MISSVDRTILRHLFKSGCCTTYEIHKIYKFSPFQIYVSIEKLSDMDLITYKNEEISLNDSQKLYIFKNYHLLFKSEKYNKNDKFLEKITYDPLTDMKLPNLGIIKKKDFDIE